MEPYTVDQAFTGRKCANVLLNHLSDNGVTSFNEPGLVLGRDHVNSPLLDPLVALTFRFAHSGARNQAVWAQPAKRFDMPLSGFYWAARGELLGVLPTASEKTVAVEHSFITIEQETK